METLFLAYNYPAEECTPQHPASHLDPDRERANAVPVSSRSGGRICVGSERLCRHHDLRRRVWRR